MLGKTLIEIRDLAKEMAERRGHTIKRWNRKRHHYTAACEKCRASLRAYSRAEDAPGRTEMLDLRGGTLIARSRERYWTEVDYNWADGTALSTYCFLPRP